MDKKLQDLAWRILPVEFREEVKKYLTHYRYALNTHEAIINHIFGKHNLTSDAEGEEMLTVEANLVKELYQRAKEIEEESKRTHSPLVAAKYRGVQRAIEDLFGSKCLPDDTKDDTKEPKPVEPKYHKGEKVYYNGYVYEVEGLVGKNRYALKGLNFDLHEDMIDPYEPYTEPEEMRIASEESHLRNLSQNIADCDKEFDNILKDSFRNERRLNIAAMIEPSLIANPDLWKQHRGYGQSHTFAKLSLEFADALIAECEKGGKK